MCTANVSCLSYIRNEKNCKKQRRQTFLDDLSLWGVGFWEDESRKLLGLFFTLLYSRIVPTWNCNLHRCTFLMWLPDKPKMGWKNLHLVCLIKSQSWNTLFWNIISLFNAIMHFRCLLNQEGKRSVVCVCNWIERPQIDHNGSKLIRHALQRCHDLKIIFWTSSLLSQLLPK